MQYIEERFSYRTQLFSQFHPNLSSQIEKNIINQNPTVNNNIDIHKKTIYELEAYLKDEFKHEADIALLETYLKEELIPRGLRITTLSTFPEDDVFTQKWRGILSTCSRALMVLIIEKRNKMLEHITTQIDKLKENISSFEKIPELHTLMNNMTIRIKKFENDITAIKLKKLQRDRQDYITGNIYRNNQPNLKYKFQEQNLTHQNQKSTRSKPYKNFNNLHSHRYPSNREQVDNQIRPFSPKVRTFFNSDFKIDRRPKGGLITPNTVTSPSPIPNPPTRTSYPNRLITNHTTIPIDSKTTESTQPSLETKLYIQPTEPITSSTSSLPSSSSTFTSGSEVSFLDLPRSVHSPLVTFPPLIEHQKITPAPKKRLLEKEEVGEKEIETTGEEKKQKTTL